MTRTVRSLLTNHKSGMEIKKKGESFISLKTRNDTLGSLDNSTFEGNVGNWIQQGIADGTLDMSAASFGEVNVQGLPDR